MAIQTYSSVPSRNTSTNSTRPKKRKKKVGLVAPRKKKKK